MTGGEPETEKRRRRPRGEGGVRWSEARQRWIAEKTVGYDPRGKRIVRTGTGTSQSAALRDLRRRVHDYEAGLVPGSEHCRVREVVEDWLRFGQGQAAETTRKRNSDLCKVHVIPKLGERKLRQLEPSEVDRWLEGLAPTLATSTLHRVHSCLNRAVRRAMKRGLVERNVVELAEVPSGRVGRPSKSLTLDQARDVLVLTQEDPLHCYIVTSMLTGARTEEVRALRWRHVHLDDCQTGVPAHLEVWRSVRTGGDTKTRKSRRTLALPELVVVKLREHRARQAARTLAHGKPWDENALVFPSSGGTEMDAANVRRDFRRALRLVAAKQRERHAADAAGGDPAATLDPTDWTPRELRHSFVSLLSDAGLSIEDISRLVGHKGTNVTELVYRKQLRPVIEHGARAMDMLFAPRKDVGPHA